MLFSSFLKTFQLVASLPFSDLRYKLYEFSDPFLFACLFIFCSLSCVAVSFFLMEFVSDRSSTVNGFSFGVSNFVFYAQSAITAMSGRFFFLANNYVNERIAFKHQGVFGVVINFALHCDFLFELKKRIILINGNNNRSIRTPLTRRSGSSWCSPG